ncbi:MAG: nucleoside phosphorylase [Planctomycetes bacterium SCN 63-9]|nr:MAG: nucleoside phosphorylase [Planctomycetes bacterium SCN 63-9]
MGHRASNPNASPPYTAPAPIPADVGIVAALPLELGFFVDRLKKVRKYKTAASTIIEGEFGNKVVAVVYSGAGRSAARIATQILIAGHRPNLIISAGFAGGLNPGFTRGQLIYPSEILDLDGNRFPVALLDTHEAPSDASSNLRLLTVDAIARTAAEKADLRTRFGADLVDMETSAVAEVCQSQGHGFLSIRTISDDAAAELPAEIVAMLNRSLSFQVGAAFRAIWNRPTAVKDFWTLHSNAIEASDQLAKGLGSAIERYCG